MITTLIIFYHVLQGNCLEAPSSMLRTLKCGTNVGVVGRDDCLLDGFEMDDNSESVFIDEYSDDANDTLYISSFFSKLLIISLKVKGDLFIVIDLLLTRYNSNDTRSTI